jgi:hypothetical protein
LAAGKLSLLGATEGEAPESRPALRQSFTWPVTFPAQSVVEGVE